MHEMASNFSKFGLVCTSLNNSYCSPLHSSRVIPAWALTQRREVLSFSELLATLDIIWNSVTEFKTHPTLRPERSEWSIISMSNFISIWFCEIEIECRWKIESGRLLLFGMFYRLCVALGTLYNSILLVWPTFSWICWPLTFAVSFNIWAQKKLYI